MTSTAMLRYNEGKPLLSLVPRALIVAAARALGYGARKYARDNWRKGAGYTEVVDSLLRHAFAFLEGEDFDPESGCHHVDHMAANVAFLAEFTQNRPDLDDRATVKPQAEVFVEGPTFAGYVEAPSVQ